MIIEHNIPANYQEKHDVLMKMLKSRNETILAKAKELGTPSHSLSRLVSDDLTRNLIISEITKISCLATPTLYLTAEEAKNVIL